MEPVWTRHIHPDFHTSEHIPGVGSRCDKRQWQATSHASYVIPDED